LHAGEPEAIPDLLPVLITGDKRSIKASAEAIHGLLRQLKPMDFVSFDQFVRQGYSDWRPRRESWYTMKPRDVSHIADIGEESVSILGIASFHASGYVREEAARALGRIETGAELPFLIIRANDWVDSVRSLARSLLLARIRSDYLPHILMWLPLALRLGNTRRDDHSTIIQAIRKVFETPEARKTLEAGFESPDKFARRFCFEIALNSDVADLQALLKRAFHTQDLQIRRAAVTRLRAILPHNELNEFLVVARRDSSATVRGEALNIYLEKFREQAEQEFQSALLDSNISIRERAQQFFEKKSAFDIRGYYTKYLNVDERRKLAATIAGLGETGLAIDSRLVESFFTNYSPRVRTAALHAVAKLNRDAYIDQFVFALEDPSARVGREGALALSKKANLVGGLRLWEVYVRTRHLHSKRFVLYLLARINKWDSVTYLIQSLSDQDERLVELSTRYITRWFARYNRSFVAPSAGQLKRLRDILGELSLLVSSETQHKLESILKSFGG
jgi:HEAT repeat protein